MIEVPGRAWFRRLAGDPSSSKDHVLQVLPEVLPVPAVLTSTEGAQQLRDDVTDR